MSAGEILRNEKLNYLFDRLFHSETQAEIDLVVSRIWHIWLDSGDEDVNHLMEVGCRALAASDYAEAVRMFSLVIQVVPEYPEGWNKRATAHYLRGTYREALRDAEKVLELEPRHFGAMSGMAMIYSVVGSHKALWQSLRRLRDLYPHHNQLKAQIEGLSQRLGFLPDA